MPYNVERVNGIIETNIAYVWELLNNCLFLCFLYTLLVFLFSDQPTVSGLQAYDYPIQKTTFHGRTLQEIGDIRKVPLPPELQEQFGRIFF